ncbi:hypothetical protein BU17DRAFT_96388 [Hysterangium stoloniferum]|nr:hypothetical protein BU17DRAFT_96388 [Hysterangium stoloniferum]
MTQIYSPPPATPHTAKIAYAPPPGPPPQAQHSHPPPLLAASFPLLTQSQIDSLSSLGFTTFPISRRQSLYNAAHKLFALSRAFFAQPQPSKERFKVWDANAQGSEEGWSHVVGEKELITLRRGGATCPESVESAGREMWAECGKLMKDVMEGVEGSLGLDRCAFGGIYEAECNMPAAERVETLLRMFRYERRAQEIDDEETAKNNVEHTADPQAPGKGRLVSAQHIDLGLLSLVIGSSPGLEVWDYRLKRWIPIEEPPYTDSTSGELTATLLVGETLTRLTNGRYLPGRHRVFVPSVPATAKDGESQYRYSLVFALRPHPPSIISTSALTTPITGHFKYPIEEVTAGELFGAIARSHWNVNTEKEAREAQRKRLTERENGD